MKRIIYLLLVMAALSGCTTLETPEIKGIVVDAETGKPIEGARISATWQRTNANVGGRVSGSVDKKLKLVTDKDGRFSIPAHLMINYRPYPFGQGGYFNLTIYHHGYKHIGFAYKDDLDLSYPYYEEFKNRQNNRIVFKLNEIKDPDVYDINQSEIYDIVKDDLNYLLIGYKIFTEKFAHDKRASGYKLSIGTIYEEIKEYDKAADTYKEIQKQFPNSNEAKEATNRLQRLIQLRGNKYEK